MPEDSQINDSLVGETHSSWPNGKPSPQANPTVRPVTLGAAAPEPLTPTGSLPNDEAEAMSAYRTIEARRKRKRRNRIIVGCLLAALALGGLGWWLANSVLVPPAQQSETPSYEVGYALLDNYEKSVTASGAIMPASQVVVTPEVEGIITDIHVAEGDNVLKGDALFSLRNASLDKAVQDAEQTLKTANNAVVSAQNALNNANNTFANAERNYNTVFSMGFETQEEADAAGNQATEAYLTAQAAVTDAELALENAQLSVTSAQEALDQARTNAEKRTVYAPQSGAIVAMNAVEGASVGTTPTTAGSNSLITIADLSSLRVSVQVNEVDINSLAEGQKAEVTFTALPNVVLEAVIERIAAISSSSGEQSMGGGIVTYAVDMVIDKPNPQVKPGMTARVKILTERITNAMTVPYAALTMVDDTNATIQVANGYSGSGEPTFEERAVTVVAQDGTTAVIEGQINDGDAVQVFYPSAEEETASN